MIVNAVSPRVDTEASGNQPAVEDAANPAVETEAPGSVRSTSLSAAFDLPDVSEVENTGRRKSPPVVHWVSEPSSPQPTDVVLRRNTPLLHRS